MDFAHCSLLSAEKIARNVLLNYTAFGSLRNTELLIRLFIAHLEGAEAKKMLEVNLSSMIPSPKP